MCPDLLELERRRVADDFACIAFTDPISQAGNTEFGPGT